MAEDPENRSWIEAQWDAPPWIRAGISTRHGGYSQPPYDSLNLAYHVGDKPETVTLNRRYLKDLLDLPGEPLWLNQVHGNRVIEAGSSDNLDADGSFTDKPELVCVIMAADCLPLLICDNSGTKIAAVHVGWRGYCAGIITMALEAFRPIFQELIVWIGPHIRQNNYEVGDDVYYSCINRDK